MTDYQIPKNIAAEILKQCAAMLGCEPAAILLLRERALGMLFAAALQAEVVDENGGFRFDLEKMTVAPPTAALPQKAT